MNPTILIDSNVLIYAINSSSPKHLLAQSYLQANVGQMTIAHQNIFETLRVLTHKKFPNPMPPIEAINAIMSIVKGCLVIEPQTDTYQISLALIQKHNLKGDKVFDAYLAATAMSVGITSIVTDNVKDFLAFDGITVINPFMLDISLKP
jgi:predicted nucleic acid-binding protein